MLSKLVYDNPAWVDKRTKEEEERKRQVEAARQLAETTSAERAKEKLQREKMEHEARDRKLLVELKAKYDGNKSKSKGH